MPSDLFTGIDHSAASTPWLHTPMEVYASLGLVLLAGLPLAGWWVARSRDDCTMAAALPAPVAVVVAVVLQQPVISWAGHPRPFVVHPDALVLVSRSADSSFPSDHACVVGAVSAVLSLLMAFACVYVGVHWPADVAAGLLFGAAVATVVVLLLRAPASRLVARARAAGLARVLGTEPAAD